MQLAKNKYIAALIILFSMAGSSAAASFTAPEAKRGVLDLRDWSPETDGPVALAGQWDFYWKKFLTEADFTDRLPEPDARPSIPSFWNRISVKGEKLPDFGYGTYRLRILLGKTDRILGLKARAVFSAYTLFINGQDIIGAGKAEKLREETRPAFRPGIKWFHRGDTNQLSIVVHVSNFHHSFGGLGRNFVLGRVNDLHLLREKSIALDLMVFGCLLIIGIFYLVLFWFRRQEFSSLFFALLCLFLSIRSVLLGEVFLAEVFPDLSFNLTITLLDSFYCLAVLSFLLYSAFLFNRFISWRIVNFFTVLSGVVVLAVVLSPVQWDIWFVNFFHVVTGLIMFYLFVSVLNAAIRKVFGARLYLAGFFLLLLVTINDILFNLGLIKTAFLAPFGLVLFILMQTFVLSGRFSRAFSNVERLTGDLAEVNKNLSNIVEERTEELNAAMEELQASNDNLTTVNRDLEEARKTADRDIEMAAHVQRSYFPETAPYTKNWDIASYFRPAISVSGDFYDFYLDDDNLRGAGLFDVSGHGIASGLITMLSKATFFRTFMSGLNRPLNEVVAYANGILQSELDKVDNYLTGVLLRFEDNRVEYANAAHSDILVKKSGIVNSILKEDGESISGAFLGVPFFNLPYEILTFTVDSGDAILMFSDCLVENKNIKREFYGKERVIESFKNAPETTARETLDYIIKDFFDFVGSGENLTDDLTVVLLRRK